jgi:CRISPR-associated protein Cas1
LIKDTLILPLAFICAKAKMSEQAFRQQCLELFTRHNALDFMFDAVKQMSTEGYRL